MNRYNLVFSQSRARQKERANPIDNYRNGKTNH
jgi:hypothetical protein